MAEEVRALGEASPPASPETSLRPVDAIYLWVMARCSAFPNGAGELICVLVEACLLNLESAPHLET